MPYRYSRIAALAVILAAGCGLALPAGSAQAQQFTMKFATLTLNDIQHENLKRFKDELGNDSKVVATGGLASIVARETNMFTIVNPDLTLIGLKLIYELNRNGAPEEAAKPASPRQG